MKKYLTLFWPLGFIIFVWFVFASPYFFQNKTPYPTQYQMSYFTPWNAYPQYAGPVKNNAISDVINQLYPWRNFSIEQWKKGEVAFWNPYSFAGNPHLANYQSAVFSPFNLLFLVLPFIDAWSLLVLFQPLLAGVFTYLFLRTFKISEVGSALGSIAFMFCGFITAWMPFGTLSMAVALLPLLLFAIEKYFQHSQLRYLLLLCFGIVTSFFSGHFQMSLYITCFAAAYLFFAFFRNRKKKLLFPVIVAFIGGLVISLLQIIPSLNFYNLAVRSELLGNTGGIPWYYLVTFFAPDFFGNPVTRNDWIGHYAEWANFIGIIPFALAVAALFEKKHKNVIYFFFFAGLVTLLLALDTPLQQLFAALKIPILSTSIPARIVVLFSFSFAVLAALGFDLLKAVLKEKSFKQLVILFIPSALLLLFVWLYLLFFPAISQDKVLLAERNMLLPSMLLFILFCLTTAAFFLKKRSIIFAFAVGILLLTAFDSWRFAQKWVPFEDRNMLFPQVPAVTAMQKEIGYGRVYGDFGAYLSMYYHLPVVDGYDPLYSKRYGEFIQSANTGHFTPALRSEVILDERGKYTQRVIDLLGVTLIYQPIAHSNQPFAFPVWDDPHNFPTLYRDEQFAVFANDSAMPRVQIFSQYEVINDSKKLLERFFEDEFDYRNVLLLEEDPKIPQSKELNPTNEAKIVAYSPNKVVIAVTAAQASLLFLSDSYYPGWRVKLNGKEQKLYRADYTLRGVVVPEGKSTVEFYFNGLF